MKKNALRNSGRNGNPTLGKKKPIKSKKGVQNGNTSDVRPDEIRTAKDSDLTNTISILEEANALINTYGLANCRFVVSSLFGTIKSVSKRLTQAKSYLLGTFVQDNRVLDLSGQIAGVLTTLNAVEEVKMQFSKPDSTGSCSVFSDGLFVCRDYVSDQNKLNLLGKGMIRRMETCLSCKCSSQRGTACGLQCTRSAFSQKSALRLAAWGGKPVGVQSAIKRNCHLIKPGQTQDSASQRVLELEKDSSLVPKEICKNCRFFVAEFFNDLYLNPKEPQHWCLFQLDYKNPTPAF